MKSVSTKKSIKHPLHLLFYLTFASWCLPFKTPAVISQYIWAPIFHCTSFPFGRSWWNPLPCRLHMAHIFSRIKSKWECRRWRFNYIPPPQFHVTSHSTIWWNWFLHIIAWKVSSDIFKCLSGFSYCSIQFCTKVMEFEQPCNLETNKNFHLGLTYFGKFLPSKGKPFTFSIHCLPKSLNMSCSKSSKPKNLPSSQTLQPKYSS